MKNLETLFCIDLLLAT